MPVTVAPAVSRRGVMKRLGVAVKAVAAMDLPQLVQGGPFPEEDEGKKRKAGKKK